MIKYPKYKREESLSCKLTNSDIETIRYLKAKGFTQHQLAKRFNVSISTIQRWTNERYRLRKLKSVTKWHGKKRADLTEEYIIYRRIKCNRSKKRKSIVRRQEYLAYMAQTTRKYKLKRR